MIVLMTIAAVFLPVLGVSPLIQDYLVHFLIFLMCSGFVGLIINNKVVLYTSFGCAGVLALFLKNASNITLKDPELNQNEKISIAHLNLSVITGMEDVMKLVSDSTIEIISVQEYTPDWATILPTITEKYLPYRYEDVRVDLYGKAIFSRTPLLNNRLGENKSEPLLISEIVKGNTKFTLVSAYIAPALDNLSRSIAGKQFEELERLISQHPANYIVLGEFNQVYWAHDIINLRDKTKLLNSRRNVSPASLKMPYDHIFYSPQLECHTFGELTDNEGNHTGCKAVLQVARDNNLKQ